MRDNPTRPAGYLVERIPDEICSAWVPLGLTRTGLWRMTSSLRLGLGPEISQSFHRVSAVRKLDLTQS
jgi:hypothetical protein